MCCTSGLCILYYDFTLSVNVHSRCTDFIIHNFVMVFLLGQLYLDQQILISREFLV